MTSRVAAFRSLSDPRSLCEVRPTDRSLNEHMQDQLQDMIPFEVVQLIVVFTANTDVVSRDSSRMNLSD